MTKEQRLKKRHGAERRFRFYGIASICVALLFVLILVNNIFSKGSSAFMKTVINVEVFFDPELIEIENGAPEENIREADFYDITIETLLKAYPAKNLDEENELIDLFTTDAEIEIKKAFLENNNLIGKKINLEITASDDIDQLHKGNYPRNLPEDRRRISNFQLKIYDTLVENHSTEELVAVLAHEIGHFKRKHIIQRIVLSLVQFAILFYILGLLINPEGSFSRQLFNALSLIHI